MTLTVTNSNGTGFTTERTRTREEWLELAVDKLRPFFAEIDIELPKVRVSVGWPSHGGTASKKKVIGQCWKANVAADGVAQIFISPVLGGTFRGDVIHMLGVLIHELIHAWDDCQSGHKGRFTQAARRIGLEGKMTATTVSGRLAPRLNELIEEIGDLPHAPLIFEEMEKQRTPQTTRMIKVACPDDGYIVRTTQKWIDLGLPTCPCGTEMELAS